MMMMMRVSSGKFDTSLKGKFREKKKRDKNESRKTRLSVSLAKKEAISSFFTFWGRHRSRRTFEKKKRHATERTNNLYIYLRVNVFPFKTEERMSFLTVGTVECFA